MHQTQAADVPPDWLAWITRRLDMAYWQQHGAVTVKEIHAELLARHSALVRRQPRPAAPAAPQRAPPPPPDQARGTPQQPAQRARALISHPLKDLR